MTTDQLIADLFSRCSIEPVLIDIGASGGTPRIWLGGIIAYGISQTLNVTLFAALKGREGSRMLWLRAIEKFRQLYEEPQ